MAKPALFLDFDGTKFDTVHLQIDYINRRYSIRASVEDFYQSGGALEKVIAAHMSPKTCPTREAFFHDLGKNHLAVIEEHQNVRLIDGARDVLIELARRYRLCTVTARHKSSLKVVEHLLNVHLPGCIADIHCVWEHFEDGTVRGDPKRDFVARYPGQKAGFIDDSPFEVKHMQDLIPSYLFDPRGLNADPEIKMRVRGWREIGEIFLGAA